MTDHFAGPDTPASSPITDRDLYALLNRPSYAAQVLLTAADLLDDAPDEPLADYVRDQAIEWADRAVFNGLPTAIRNDSLTQALAALPPVDIVTHGEYAALLRTTAEGLR